MRAAALLLVRGALASLGVLLLLLLIPSARDEVCWDAPQPQEGVRISVPP